MGLHWPTILGCLCILVSITHSAVVPTEDTLVITKSDDAVRSSEPSGTLAEPTTEGPLPPVKVLEMHVVSEVTLRYSHTTVSTLVKNPAKRSQETVFRVLLPETAFISGFSMTIDGKKYDAYVKEKEEAKQIYTDAVSQGIGAAHIAAKARDSNHFTVSVNVEPSSVAFFNLTYEELLSRRNSLYSQTINLQPGSLVPNMTVVVHIKESQKITTVRVPEITTGNEITPTDDTAQNTKSVITRSPDEREVTVVFKPDLEEQKRLMEIYAQKSKESSTNARRWYQDDEEEESNEGIIGQYVVQYDVDRTAENDILVNDGYFVHFFAPTDLPPLEKHVVFVLDTSGSMLSRKIEQLREAMQLILGNLNKGDYFSIVEFASSVTVHDLREVDQAVTTQKPSYYYYQKDKTPVKLIPPFPATPENIAKAKLIVGNLQADGGTNIDEALSVATDLVHRGVGWKESTISAIDTSNNNASLDTNKAEINNTKNGYNINLEPMIIFLTDGEPTVGESDPKRIISRFIEKNYGERKASTFSLAFGDDADGKFLRQLSLNNNGFSRHIYEAADAVLQLRDFYQQVTLPLLAHVNFKYSPDQVKEDSITKSKFRTYYAGSEIVVAGRIDNTATEILPIVSGFRGIDEGFAPRKLYEFRPRIIVKEEKKEYLPLERLWAYLTIKQSLDDRDAAKDFGLTKDTDEPKKETPEKKALRLALQYSFVTDLTSLVVVKPNETSAVNAESVDKLSEDFGSYIDSGLHFDSYVIGALPAPPGAFSSLVGYPNSAYPSLLLNNRFGNNPITTPFTLILEKEKEPLKSSLDVYNLVQYPWVQPLLNSSADELVIQVNGTDVHLKLTKDVNVQGPETLGDDTCGVSTAGTAGSCVYLTRCEAARNITVDLYSSIYCTVNGQYAGVCCPNDRSTASTKTSTETTDSGTESKSGHAS